jgi:hypothetical protein
MTTRRAACSCGQLHLMIEGEPSRISMCHCLECQRRTGAVISNQARFRREQVTFGGEATAWTRTSESGNALTFHFCPTCGSTVYCESEGFPGYVAVAIGNFADPSFPAPSIAVWEESRTLGSRCPPTRRPGASPSRGDKEPAVFRQVSICFVTAERGQETLDRRRRGPPFRTRPGSP